VTATEKKREFLLSAAYYLTIAAIVFLVLKYAIFVVMPFLIGFVIAASLNPLIRLLQKRFGMRRKPCGILILLLFYATIGMLVTILIVRLAVWIGDFSTNLPELYSDTVEPALGWLFARVGDAAAWIDRHFDGALYEDWGRDLAGIFDSLKTSLGEAVSALSVRALTGLSGIAAKIPRFVIGLLFAVLASFFFIADYEELLSFAKSRLPAKAVGTLTGLRDRFFTAIAKYLRSYALIMLITFGELLVGLFLIGAPNAPMLALVIAIFDVLPLIGTGGILIPWAFLELMRGDVGFAAGLAILWAVITVVRNVIEPRIVGKQVGLHPLFTLAAMFIGTRLFGFVGLIALPVGLSVAASLLRENQ